MDKIYFKNPNTNSLGELLQSMISSSTNNFVPTYKTEECKYEDLECGSAYRSFKDILKICQTYINCTASEVAKELMKIPNIQCIFCTSIEKYVFSTETYFNNSSRYPNRISNPDIPEREPVDGFLFSDFLSLVNE